MANIMRLGGGGKKGLIEVSTAAEMNALLVEANIGKAYKFTGTTDDTYTNGDIYVVEEVAQIISFTVDSTSYQAEEGMTWAEWVSSEYNTGGFYIDSSSGEPYVFFSVSGRTAAVEDSNYMYITGNDIIVSEYAYNYEFV